MSYAALLATYTNPKLFSKRQKSLSGHSSLPSRAQIHTYAHVLTCVSPHPLVRSKLSRGVKTGPYPQRGRSDGCRWSVRRTSTAGRHLNRGRLSPMTRGAGQRRLYQSGLMWDGNYYTML